MKVKFIRSNTVPQRIWEGDLQNIPFKKGDALDITALRYIKTADGVGKETIQSFDGIFEIADIAHKLTFEVVLSQNITYNECVIYLKRK